MLYWRGPNTEVDQKSDFNNVQVGVGAPTQRNWTPISTGNASWGRGPNTEKLDPNFNRQCKLGTGPQHREIGPQFQQAMQVGVKILIL
ncbi:hypothetical protein UC16_08305 [Staphylococcus aureus]|nr:hypothetical protein UC16_08305 [Staphylococcus aureus]